MAIKGINIKKIKDTDKSCKSSEESFLNSVSLRQVLHMITQGQSAHIKPIYRQSTSFLFFSLSSSRFFNFFFVWRRRRWPTFSVLIRCIETLNEMKTDSKKVTWSMTHSNWRNQCHLPFRVSFHLHQNPSARSSQDRYCWTRFFSDTASCLHFDKLDHQRQYRCCQCCMRLRHFAKILYQQFFLDFHQDSVCRHPSKQLQFQQRPLQRSKDSQCFPQRKHCPKPNHHRHCWNVKRNESESKKPVSRWIYATIGDGIAREYFTNISSSKSYHEWQIMFLQWAIIELFWRKGRQWQLSNSCLHVN